MDEMAWRCVSLRLIVFLVLLASEAFSLIKSALQGRLYLTGRSNSRDQEAPEAATGFLPPAPPSTLAIVLAEAQAGAIDTHKLAQILIWSANKPSLQQVYLYDPAGHIQARQQDLACVLRARLPAPAAPTAPAAQPEQQTCACAQPPPRSGTPPAAARGEEGPEGGGLAAPVPPPHMQGQLRPHAGAAREVHRRHALSRALVLEAGWQELGNCAGQPLVASQHHQQRTLCSMSQQQLQLQPIILYPDTDKAAGSKRHTEREPGKLSIGEGLAHQQQVHACAQGQLVQGSLHAAACGSGCSVHDRRGEAGCACAPEGLAGSARRESVSGCGEQHAKMYGDAPDACCGNGSMGASRCAASDAEHEQPRLSCMRGAGRGGQGNSSGAEGGGTSSWCSSDCNSGGSGCDGCNLPSLHVRLLSCRDSHAPVLAAARQLGSRVGAAEVPMQQQQQQQQDEQENQQQQKLCKALEDHQCSAGSTLRPGLDPQDPRGFQQLWDSGSSAARCSSLKAPGRSYRQSAELLVQQMVAACGPRVTADPQLVLVYSSGPLTLAGFSPFHARAAEILGMGPLGQATESGFEAAFVRYANIKQRFGK